jgi:hypothetical protein
MRIKCGECGTRVEILDTRGSGKTFKIRCRSCKAVIVVRATMDPTEVTPRRVIPRAAWYVVINDGVVGPISTSEVFERYVGGEITNLTYIWRKGFEDYKELWRVSEFDALTGRGKE